MLLNFSPIPWIVLLFCWWFSLLCKKTLVLCSPICLYFYFVSLAREIYQIKYCYKQCPRFYCLFSSGVFILLSLTFKSLIHFEFILVCGVRRSSFIFLHGSVQFPNTIYLIDCLYPMVCFCLLCQILIAYKRVGLSLGSLCCPIDLYLCFYDSTMLFKLLWLYSIVRYQLVWFLQLCPSFSRFLWLFGVFCGSI